MPQSIALDRDEPPLERQTGILVVGQARPGPVSIGRPIDGHYAVQRIKPDVYPKVEDEATVVVTYPKAQGIIQASWNWPYNRKDMEVYGKSGYVLVPPEGPKA